MKTVDIYKERDPIAFIGVFVMFVCCCSHTRARLAVSVIRGRRRQYLSAYFNLCRDPVCLYMSELILFYGDLFSIRWLLFQ